MKGIQNKDINENNMNKSDNLTSVKVHGMIVQIIHMEYEAPLAQAVLDPLQCSTEHSQDIKWNP